MADPSSSLSARAQEILQRADSQLAALRRPAVPERDPVAEPRWEPRAEPADTDLGQLLDTVQAGIEAARAHLVALAASLDRIAQELGPDHAAETAVPEGAAAEPAPLPAALEAHSVAPPERQPGPPEPEAKPEPVPTAEQASIERRTNAAHDAARLVAIEMAVAGDTREVVGRRLRNEFGIPDPHRILDDVYGPEGGPPGARRGYGI